MTSASSTLEGPVRTRKVETPIDGVETWVNDKNGFRVVDLHYSADPRKRSVEWLVEARKGMTTADWNREYEKQWLVHAGKPVYRDYSEPHHLARGDIVVPRRTRLVCGWDAGPQDVNLAWVLGIAVPGENRVTFIDEYFADDGDPEAFVEVVHGRFAVEWYKLGGFKIHVADQSVFTKAGNERHAFADLMRRYNMPPVSGEISFAKRRAAVERLLTHTFRSPDGAMVPRLRVHERCVMIREAFKGGYQYPEIGGRAGEYREFPIKNKHSHIANAVEYVCSKLTLVEQDVPYEGRPLPAMSVI